MSRITVIGGGLAGLTAAIACAEEGGKVRLLEAHETLGGRARSDGAPYKTNFGPHALYSDGPLWQWCKRRDLLPAYARPTLSGVRLRWQGELRRTPPLGMIPHVLRLRGREAPVELDFRSWARKHTDTRTAELLSNAAGVYTFHHDPGELSAAFVWERTVRALLSPLPVARFPIGGWSALVAKLERHARELGVAIETSSRVQELPEAPVIVATELPQARVLLDEPQLDWPSGRTLCLDLALRHRRGDPYVVADLDEAGWVERFTASDGSLAPAGEELFQAQMPLRPGETAEQAQARLERLLDLALVDRRARETWRRRQVMDARTGALDLPGSTWRERPAVDRGDGVFLAGDMVAAPGLLAEVSWASAIEAARLAVAAGARGMSTAAPSGAPSLRRVA
ncbi:MAG TPA: NAD(P)-binding protein [Solirubrobacteraceae bacterium]|jgi:glycine/D-amino acid oxidase-like deaminating enzyme